MGNFKGVMTHQTVSNKDFSKLMTIASEEIKNWANVDVKIVDDANILYKEMARSIADVIVKNNTDKKDTKIILPVGPTPQYAILAQIINTEKINLEKSMGIFYG